MNGDLAAANAVIHSLYCNIGARIRTARDARGLTQAALAAAVGLSRGSLANIESGNQRTPVHTMVAIAQALRLDPADVISDGVLNLPSLAAELPPSTGPLRIKLVDTRDRINELLAALGVPGE